MLKSIVEQQAIFKRSKPQNHEGQDEFLERLHTLTASFCKQCDLLNEKQAEEICRLSLTINNLIDDIEAIQQAVIKKH